LSSGIGRGGVRPWLEHLRGRGEEHTVRRGDVGNVLAATRHDRVVEALGGHGEHVTEAKDIRPALERARASGKASCVNVMIDPNVYSSGTMNQTMYK
jgi:acetolactate synthase-1/2/3 large subunit